MARSVVILSNQGHKQTPILVDLKSTRLSDLLQQVFSNIEQQYVYVRNPGDDPILSVRFEGTVAGLALVLADILESSGYEVKIDIRGRLLIFPRAAGGGFIPPAAVQPFAPPAQSFAAPLP